MKVIRQLACVGVMLIVGFISDSEAAAGYAGGKPWQVGDFIACIGGGTCNAIRIVNGSPILLDQFSDPFLGETRGVWMNNTLHAVAVDNGGGNQSNVVVYTIASVVPFLGTTVSHTPVSTFTANGPAASGNNAQAVLVNSIGHIFVGNAGTGNTPGVSIVELNPDGSLAGTVGNGGAMFSNPLQASCANIAGERLSMDLSKDGSTMYLTTSQPTYQTGTSNGGDIDAVTLSSGSCAPFASFGPGVALNGVQDIPMGALTGCNGSGCPSNDMLLVLAEGFYDIDGDSSSEPTIPDQADDANICNGQVNSGLVSCALLLSTGGPGLSAPFWLANHAYSVGDSVLDASLHVQTATTAGTSGPTAPGWNDQGSTTPDNTVTWQDQGTSVVTRYPIATGIASLQSLSLGPLVTDCTGNNCSSSIPGPTVSDFFVGDSQAPNVYDVTFATGAVSLPININGNMSSVCPQTCTPATSVEGFRIYAAEGSYQADLTKLFTGSLAASGNGATVVVNYPPAVGPFTTNDTNSWTLTQYGSNTSTPITLYASLISQASAVGNNSGATDPGSLRVNNTIFPNPVPCFASTTDPSKCIVWKADVQIPSGAYLSETIFAPNNIINSGTDLFVDLHYDITTTPGVSDTLTGGRSSGSVHSLHEVATQFANGGPNASGCTYSSPVAGACYKTNRGTLNFTFQCSGLTSQQFANMQFSPGPPDVSLVQTFPNANPKPAPKTVVLNGTNGKAPYRYSTTGSTGPNYTFQWNLNGAATSGQIDLNKTDHLRGCTFDPTGTVQTFCVDFTTDPTCK